MENNPTSQQLLIDPREAARLLCISARTLWTLSKTGAVRSIKIGRLTRYSIACLEKFIAEKLK